MYSVSPLDQNSVLIFNPKIKYSKVMSIDYSGKQYEVIYLQLLVLLSQEIKRCFTLKKSIYLSAVSGLCGCTDFPARRGKWEQLSSCRVQIGENTVVASPVAEHGLLGTQALAAVVPGLQQTGSIAVAYRLSCSPARETFPNRGQTRVSCWQADSLPLSRQGSKPHFIV